jgi:hypothetical protein
LSLALGVAVSAFAQDREQEEKAKPAEEEKKAQPEKPAKQAEKNGQEEKKNAKPEENNARREENAKPEEKSAQQEQKNTKPEERNAEQRAPEAKPERQEQHAAGGGDRIPADRYKAHFGQQHTFRVSQGDYRNHRFQYGGYSFGFVDAWPSNWLYTQNVYVIEIDGVYYLCNPEYPGVNLTLSFTL